MGRLLPVECHHGVTIDWGDFGPCQDCDHDVDECPNFTPCSQCTEEREAAESRARTTVDLLRAVVAAWDDWTRDDAAITWERQMDQVIEAAREHLNPSLPVGGL